MLTMTTQPGCDRASRIQAQAEELALGLIRQGLTSTDPRLASICSRLTAFQPLLNGKNVDEKRARDLIRMGFGMVKFQPSPAATDEDETLRLLDGLSHKISGMGRLLLGFIGR